MKVWWTCLTINALALFSAVLMTNWGDVQAAGNVIWALIRMVTYMVGIVVAIWLLRRGQAVD